jgi:hypothetical protein
LPRVCQVSERFAPKYRKEKINIDHSILQREVCYAMKQAAKMVNYHKVVNQVNKTMQEELNLFAQALSASPNI